jgi:hypothetical protein
VYSKPISYKNQLVRISVRHSHVFRSALAKPTRLAASGITTGPSPASEPSSNFDLGDALVLVSCVKSKLAHAAPARALYEPSAWFRKVRGIIEASGSRWFVLSSRYGLVRPDDEIAPYDYTLNTLGVAERQGWATDVLRKLLPEVETTGVNRVVMFAGDR